MAWLLGKTGLRHRFRGKASQSNWEWAVALDAMLTRLDAARGASWHRGQVGTRVADKIILDITVVKTHCAEVVLASFVWLVALASRRFDCLLYTSPSPRDRTRSRMPSSA